MDFDFRLKQLLSGGQHSTNVSTAYSRSFASEIRYFFLPYTKYASEKLPFSGAKSLAECSPPIYVVLPETKKGPCIQSIGDGYRGLGDNLYDQRNAVIFSENRNLHGKHNSAVCGGTFLHSDNFGWAQLRTAAVQCNACLADSGQRQKLIG